MAEFVQTMKDWRRMCMAMEKLRPDDSCCGCSLEGYGCPAIYEEDSSHVDYADVERNVTAWAAEHPEPIYPTWREYLTSIGVINKVDITPVGRSEYAAFGINDEAFALTNTRISPDIAQKLGLQPKEG